MTLPKVISEETKELLREYSKLNSDQTPELKWGWNRSSRKPKTYTISAVAEQYGIHPQTLGFTSVKVC